MQIEQRAPVEADLFGPFYQVFDCIFVVEDHLGVSRGLFFACLLY